VLEARVVIGDHRHEHYAENPSERFEFQFDLDGNNRDRQLCVSGTTDSQVRLTAVAPSIMHELRSSSSSLTAVGRIACQSW